jgi:hypothetical protein
LDGGINTYVYGINNPIRYSDPTGEAVIALPWIVPPAIEGLAYCAAAITGAVIGNELSTNCRPLDFSDQCSDDDDDDKCDKKLSNAFLRQLGIDAHAIKRDMVPGGGWGAYNLCGCEDGRILLKRSKDCKDPGGDDTGERWK